MGRLTVLAAGLLLLAGCSGSAEPSAPPPSTSQSASPTPAPSPSLTPPVMPDAAKAHTEEGAKAFVEYFWEVVNYAQATGDTEAIRRIVDPGCEPCSAGIASIQKPYEHGGRIRGGQNTPHSINARLTKVDGTDHATVDYDISVAPVTFDYADDTKDGSLPATSGRRRARLRAEPGLAWRVVLLEEGS